MTEVEPHPSEPHRSSARDRLATVVAAVLGSLASLHYGLRLPVNDDDVYHLHSIWMVGAGAIPYREFFEVHLPGLWLLTAPLARLYETPSSYLLSARLAVAAMWAVTLILLALASRVRSRYLPVLAVAGAATAVHGQVWVFRAEYVAVTLLALHLYLLIRTDPKRAGMDGLAARALVAALPLAVGCTMTVRLLPFLIVQPVASLWAGKARGRALAGWLVGLSLGAAPTAAYLTVHGLWRDALYWSFRFVSRAGVVAGGERLDLGSGLLLALSLAALALLKAEGRGLGHRGRVILGAWLVAWSFQLLNPHRVLFADVYAYLMSALLVSYTLAAELSTGPVHRWRRWALAAAAATLYGTLAWPLPNVPQRHLAAQLEALDWLAEVAAEEAAVLIAPNHPMTTADATDLQNAWHYGIWLDQAVVRERLADLSARLSDTPPPVVARDPWPALTGGLELPEWLAANGVLAGAQHRRLHALLARDYATVALPALEPLPYGHRFWVRTDRLAAVPLPGGASREIRRRPTG